MSAEREIHCEICEKLTSGKYIVCDAHLEEANRSPLLFGQFLKMERRKFLENKEGGKA